MASGSGFELSWMKMSLVDPCLIPAVGQFRSAFCCTCVYVKQTDFGSSKLCHKWLHRGGKPHLVFKETSYSTFKNFSAPNMKDTCMSLSTYCWADSFLGHHLFIKSTSSCLPLQFSVLQALNSQPWQLTITQKVVAWMVLLCQQHKLKHSVPRENNSTRHSSVKSV